MKVTKQMLDAAMRKAVEAGLLPRDALRGDSFGEQEVIRHVLEAALGATCVPKAPTAPQPRPFQQYSSRPRLLPLSRLRTRNILVG